MFFFCKLHLFQCSEIVYFKYSKIGFGSLLLIVNLLIDITPGASIKCLGIYLLLLQ